MIVDTEFTVIGTPLKLANLINGRTINDYLGSPLRQSNLLRQMVHGVILFREAWQALILQV
jgi:hypothetical protein